MLLDLKAEILNSLFLLRHYDKMVKLRVLLIPLQRVELYQNHFISILTIEKQLKINLAATLPKDYKEATINLLFTSITINAEAINT